MLAVSLQKKTQKTEAVAPSYAPGAFRNLLVKNSTVKKFRVGPMIEKGR